MKQLLKQLLILLVMSNLIFISCSKNKGNKGIDASSKASEKGESPESIVSGQKFITIGTGGLTGVYYPTGGAIATMLNKKKDIYNLKATVESTGGSVFNVNAILTKDMDFGIVQSDRQAQAYQGLNEWKKKGPQKNLRSVFSIYGEAVTLVASEESGIQTIADLKGKKVNIGAIGSGTRQNAIHALQFADLSYKKDIIAEDVKPAEAAGFLQDKRIDAYFYTVGHPNASIKEATSGKRKVNIVSIPVSEKMLEQYSYYAKVSIPVKYYPSSVNKKDIDTFGVKATLCTREDLSEEIVYAMTKEVFENFESFKKLHPAYSALQKEDLLKGLTAPMHKGALKYYKEVGLIK